MVAQFFGHTHRDQFYLFYAPETKDPVAVGWNGGSVTTFTNVNPNYRIYRVNSLTLVSFIVIRNKLITTLPVLPICLFY